MSKATEALKTQLKDLLEKHGLEIYDQPSVVITSSSIANWNMRIGDPAAPWNSWVDGQSERNMWLAALDKIKEYIAKKSGGSS